MPKGAKGTGTKASAEDIGQRALLFLVEDQMRLHRFMRDTGLEPDELRARAGECDLLAAVLDHLSSDESLLLVFAAEAGLDPASIMQARYALSGADAGGGA